MIFAKSMFSNKAQKYVDFQLILMPPNHQILTQKCLQKCAPKLDRIFTIFFDFGSIGGSKIRSSTTSKSIRAASSVELASIWCRKAKYWPFWLAWAGFFVDLDMILALFLNESSVVLATGS